MICATIDNSRQNIGDIVDVLVHCVGQGGSTGALKKIKKLMCHGEVAGTIVFHSEGPTCDSHQDQDAHLLLFIFLSICKTLKLLRTKGYIKLLCKNLHKAVTYKIMTDSPMLQFYGVFFLFCLLNFMLI